MNVGHMACKAESSVECGTFNSNTIMVMMMAMTPSLNASNREVPMG